MNSLTRRAFIACTCTAVPALGACRRALNEPTVDEPKADGVEVAADAVRIDLSRATALAAIGSALVIPAANMMVLRIGSNVFHALSNVCTHAGCGIYLFMNARMKCQCHGSEFDIEGKNVVGPAQEPLKRYDVSRNGDVLLIRRA